MSQYGQYNYRKESVNGLFYGFTSTGPKGNFKMVVQFELEDDQRTYSLAMGNLNEDGSIDDLTVNNNKDRNKILATVAAIVYEFTLDYPDCYIYFNGSTPERTRLYRMALTISYRYLSEVYDIWGALENQKPEPFQALRNYSGFFIKRK